MKDGKFVKFIKHPPLWLCIIVWSVALGVFATSVVLAFTNFAEEWQATLLYGATLILTVLSIYLILTRTKVPHIVANSERFQRFIADYGYRSYVMCIASAVFNTVYGVFGTIFSLLSGSVWLAALVWYHIALAIVKYVVFFVSKRHSGTPEHTKYRVRAYTYCGLVLCVLALAIVPIIILAYRGENTYSYIGGMLIYAIAVAAYTFTKFGISLYSLRKAHKNGDVVVRAMKHIGFADALISMFTLQAVMLKVFEDASLAAIMTPVLGGTVVAAIFGMGLYMIIRGLRMPTVPTVRISAEDFEEDIDAIDIL